MKKVVAPINTTIKKKKKNEIQSFKLLLPKTKSKNEFGLAKIVTNCVPRHLVTWIPHTDPLRIPLE